MPFIGHFFDKVVYGSLYYFNKPDEAHIYASRDKIKLKLFVFNPLEKKSESSVLLFHGGGWAFGSSYSLFKICRDISNKGITCISADYRLALKHNSKVKDSMIDARDAYDWIIVRRFPPFQKCEKFGPSTSTIVDSLTLPDSTPDQTSQRG